MQFAKDSFYVAVRDALAAQFPARTITLAGQQRPAILVPENEARSALTAPAPFEAPPATQLATTLRLANCFYLNFGAARAASAEPSGAPALMIMRCTVTYAATGMANSSAADRGRALAELDSELLAICAAGFAPKRDYTQSPARDLGTTIVWTRPELGDVQSLGSELRRSAVIALFFYPEVTC